MNTQAQISKLPCFLRSCRLWGPRNCFFMVFPTTVTTVYSEPPRRHLLNRGVTYDRIRRGKNKLSENLMSKRNKILRGAARQEQTVCHWVLGPHSRLGHFLPECREPSVSQVSEASPVGAWSSVSELPLPFQQLNIKITIPQPHSSMSWLQPDRSSKVNTGCEAMRLWGAFRQTQLSTDPTVFWGGGAGERLWKIS